MESDSNDCFGLIDVTSDDFIYLDSTDCWLNSSDSHNCNENNNNNNDINDWIKSSFSKERSKGYHMTLVNKLDELKLLSPSYSSSINTRTFTRQKRNNNKRESLFKLNGNSLSTLYSPEDENESTSEPTMTYETHNRTFEVQTNQKSMNGTFTLNTAEDTFTVCNDCNEDDIQMNNIDDVEKIAKIQEENLRQSCSNGSSPSRQRSPIRSHLSNFNNRDKRLSYLPNSNNNINSNTLTKNRDSILRRTTLMDDSNAYPTEEDDDYYYQNGYSPEEVTFRSSDIANTSTPLVPRTTHNVNFAHETTRGSVVPKIMPNVSNLRAHSSYGHSKIGRSEPNLSKRLQPLNRVIPNSSKTNHYGIKSSDNTYTRNNAMTLIESKMPSDSRLVVRNGQMRPPVNHRTQTLGRMTSPPPSQTQQQLVGKVTVEGEYNRIGTTSTTNLCRKSTFRVRDYAINSEENLRENGVDLCITNNYPVTNGYQTNKAINNNSEQSKVQRNVSKIPGPKSIRSGIPVCGTRTAIPGPANNTNNRIANHTDNSWSNGCF